jgi:hypothetical protein
MKKVKSETAQLKYKDLLGQSQQQKNEQELQFRVEEAQHQLAADVLATKKSIASVERDLLNSKSTFPLDAQSIVSLQVKLEGLVDGLTRLQALQAELF